jgi:hypothetical protein
MVPTTALASPEGEDRDIEDMGIQAYVYAYPMVLMEITRRVSTNVESPRGAFAPMNQLAHLRAFPDHTFREVVRPNVDTLYSILWFDVTDEPVVLSLPDTGRRYYMMPLLDMWTDVFAAPGSRTTGNDAEHFAIIGPDWEGTLPEGVEPIHSPTGMGWMIGRTLTNGVSDYASVHRIQDAMKVTPLGQWGRDYTPPPGKVVDSWDMQTPPPAQVERMSAEEFFELFAGLLADNPPHEMDWNKVKLLERIGIVPGEEFEFSSLPSSTRQALERAKANALDTIETKQAGESIDGWDMAREMMGTYGTSYLQRAYIARIGLGANLPGDAVYPMATVDAEGLPFDGHYRYVLRFDEPPPVNGFWSLTLYDADGYLADNPIARYAIGDRDELEIKDDGSIELYIQHQSPGEERESNWLPAPQGEFNLVLRLYQPQRDVLIGKWNPPGVRRAD